MHISLVGVNYQTAPVTIREKVAISAEKLPSSLSLLRTYLPTAIIISTCNRTEIYAIDDINHGSREACLNFIKAHLDILDVDLQQYVYVFEDKAVVEHLFRVASGLESMVVGEYEVLGQLRQALDIAEMTRSIVKNILQEPIQYLRSNGNRDHSDIIKELFQLDEAFCNNAGIKYFIREGGQCQKN